MIYNVRIKQHLRHLAIQIMFNQTYYSVLFVRQTLDITL